MGRLHAYKHIGLQQNVTFKVIDEISGRVVQVHKGHNTVTNSMLLGIGHYLTGDGVLNQGYHMLSSYVPQYISLGTMGLISQLADADGLPAGIGVNAPEVDPDLQAALDQAIADLEQAECILNSYPCYRYDICTDCPIRCTECSEAMQAAKDAYDAAKQAYEDAYKAYLSASEEERFKDYMKTRPGFGADGYDVNANNNRKYMGIGPVFADRPDPDRTINCELISDSYPRTPISFRDIVPEIESELPRTIDVVFSALVSVGALKQFREPGSDYIFITEAGLWSKPYWVDGGDNGLLAGYRIAPPNEDNWDMSVESNRRILKENVLKVGLNQVVQVIWKIQLGSIDEFGGYPALELGNFEGGGI